MKKGYYLVVAILIIAISLFAFSACDESEQTVHDISVGAISREYDGTPFVPTIDSNGEAYEIEWFEISEGSTTKLDSAPIDVGSYRVRAYIPGTSTEASVTFDILVVTTYVSDVHVDDKVYDGNPVSAPTYSTNSGSQNITIKYRKTNSADAWDVTPPSAVGEYEVVVIVEANRNYSSSEGRGYFTISAAVV